RRRLFNAEGGFRIFANPAGFSRRRRRRQQKCFAALRIVQGGRVRPHGGAGFRGAKGDNGCYQAAKAASFNTSPRDITNGGRTQKGRSNCSSGRWPGVLWQRF